MEDSNLIADLAVHYLVSFILSSITLIDLIEHSLLTKAHLQSASKL